jgi:hypothetical protein
LIVRSKTTIPKRKQPAEIDRKDSLQPDEELGAATVKHIHGNDNPFISEPNFETHRDFNNAVLKFNVS